MIRIDKGRGEIIFSYEADKGVIQGRITYHKNMLDELTFNVSARTVSVTTDVRDVGMLLAAIGNDLMVEPEQSEVDGHITATEARRRTLNGE
jgi:phage tail protein X